MHSDILTGGIGGILPLRYIRRLRKNYFKQSAAADKKEKLPPGHLIDNMLHLMKESSIICNCR
jgi:hypothetical protein